MNTNLNSSRTLVVVAGPTAVGKTAVGVALARQLQCPVISADSRQFYRDMSIGTAKPGREETMGIPHYFVDFLPVEKEFSAGRFEVAVLEKLNDLFAEHDVVLMVGGSGLYIRAVCEGMNDIPQVPAEHRKQLYEDLVEHGLDVLVQELAQRDPEYYGRVDLKNSQRVVRALEVCRATNRPYSSFRNDQPVQRPFHMLKIGLELERPVLFDRIDRRVDQMVASGLFDEVASLKEKRHLNALKTVGYTEIFGYMDGRYDRDEAIRLLKRNTRRYAKRQLTWFKKDEDFQWFRPDDLQEIWAYIHDEISKRQVEVKK